MSGPVISVDVLDARRALLGESPRWDAHHQVVRWVDLWGGELYATSPTSGLSTSRAIGSPTTSVILTDDPEQLLVTVGSDLCRPPLDGSGTPEPICRQLAASGSRCNDSAVDPAGRIWVGTMGWTAEDSVTGELLRIDADGSVSTMLTGVRLANGMAWAESGETMWFVDSKAGTVTAYPFDLADGTLGEPQVIIHVPVTDGVPDGVAIDSEDALWVALRGSGRVRRYSATGAVLADVLLPVPTVTACAFVGPGLDRLVVTSGRRWLTPDQLVEFPLAGSLFVLDPGVVGRSTPRASEPKFAAEGGRR